MFGVVPKSIWQKTNPADEQNLCTWAMRCLLVETGNRLILIDTGIGNKQDEKFLSNYHLHGQSSLLSSLNHKGFGVDDITDVFLTHLHFDHCGGATLWNADRSHIIPQFKNAQYWSNQQHWQWATSPNDREKASFLKDNILPIQESGQLKFADVDHDLPFEIAYFSGHTDKMMLPVIPYNNKKVVFMADLLPSVGHLPLPYIMAYDTRPLITLTEKKDFLHTAVNEEYVLFLEHDATTECCTVQLTEKGVRLKNSFSLAEL